MDQSLKLSRKDELLQLARRSRAKWVLDASTSAPPQPEESIQSVNIPSHSAYDSNQSTKKNSRQKYKLPSEECIQDVLNYLSDIIDDGLYIEVETIEKGANFEYEGSNLNEEPESFTKTNLITSADYYFEFLDRLKRPVAFEIVKAMQQFVAKFAIKSREMRNSNSNFRHNESDYLEWADDIWKFLDHISQQIRLHVLWASDSEEKWVKTYESIERLIFTKLHPYIFNCDAEDVYLNQRMKERIISLGFLSPEHLDIKGLSPPPQTFPKSVIGPNVVSSNSLFQEPAKCLNNINIAKSPTDILNAIRKASLSISSILKHYRRDGSLPGADEFLPLLILSIVSSEVNSIHSVIKYLQRFVHNSKLMSESGYLLTQFVSAVHFIENVDAKALTIDPAEFEISMEKCKAASRSVTELANRHNNKQVNGGKHSGGPRSNSWDDLDSLSDEDLMVRLDLIMNKDFKGLDASRANAESSSLISLYKQF